MMSAGIMGLTLLAVQAADDAVAASNEEAKLSTVKLRELNQKFLASLSDSIVSVNYYFKLDDQGRFPAVGGYYCPNCSKLHTSSAEDLVIERRPFRVPGFLIAPDVVVSANTLIPPDAIERIEVTNYNESSMEIGEISAYYPKQEALQIKLAKALPETKPLKFLDKMPEGKEALFQFSLANEDGLKLAVANPYSGSEVSRTLIDNKDYVSTPANSLVVTKDGEVVYLSIMSMVELGDNGALFTAPEAWGTVSATAMTEQKVKVTEDCTKFLYPARLIFEQNKSKSRMSRYMDDEEDIAEMLVNAVALDKNRLLVLTSSDKQQLSRLNRIVVIMPDGKTIDAEFDVALKEFGGFIVKTPDALPGIVAPLSTKSFVTYDDDLLWGMELNAYPQKVGVVTRQTEFNGLKEGFMGELYPRFNASYSMVSSFEGEIIALNMSPRLKKERGYRGRDYDSLMVPSEMLLKQLENIDPELRPLAESDRGKLTWLGVEYQPLEEGVARERGIADLCDGGRIGLYINYVYPDSPAAELGLKKGNILLSLSAPGEKPISFDGSYRNEYFSNFPWAELDMLPEAYYDEIPEPWPSANNPLNKALTRIGSNKEVTLAVIVGDKIENFKVTLKDSPKHFEQAERFESSELGITVCEPTFELRRYFRLKDTDAGLLVSKVKAGSKASVAGIKPYEVIVSVNGTPVKTTAEFAAAVADQRELKIEVRRMANSRMVNIVLPAPGSEEADTTTGSGDGAEDEEF